MSIDSSTVSIGLRINALRRKHNLSLRDMAEKSGLTASFLSQVERGMVNTSIDSLRRITNSLNISLVELLEETSSPVSEIEPVASLVARQQLPPATSTFNGSSQPFSPVIRANNRPTLHFPDSGVTYELLTSSRAYKVEAFLSKLAPGTNIPARPLPEPTEQFVYVLNGSLLVELIDNRYELNAGDSMYFDGMNVTRFACIGNQETSVIFVITPPVF